MPFIYILNVRGKIGIYGFSFKLKKYNFYRIFEKTAKFYSGIIFHQILCSIIYSASIMFALDFVNFAFNVGKHFLKLK